MGRPKKKVISNVNQDVFALSLKMGNETISSQGTDMLEALTNLKRPDKIFLKGILTVSRGDKSRTLIMQPLKIKRMFYPLNQKFLAKDLNLLVS